LQYGIGRGDRGRPGSSDGPGVLRQPLVDFLQLLRGACGGKQLVPSGAKRKRVRNRVGAILAGCRDRSSECPPFELNPVPALERVEVAGVPIADWKT
jgi:hypothetical protein